jgi:hypothetical protein
VYVSRDNTPEADQIRLKLLRQLTGEQRVQRAADMTDECNELARDGIRARHPEYSAEQVGQAYVRLRLGDALFQVACPTAPLLAP